MNKKELAEQIADADLKLNILIDKGMGVLFSLSQREIIFEAMEEYAMLKIEAMGVQPGMRWVKASERLPENTLPFYHIKIEGTKQIGRYRSLSEGWLNYEGDFFPNDQIEWLEEAIEPKVEAMGAKPEAIHELHPDTYDLVRDFSKAIAEKLCANEKKYGWTNQWKTNEWEQECREGMIHHIEKGDPRDVAIYAAFMWKRGWSTAKPKIDSVK